MKKYYFILLALTCSFMPPCLAMLEEENTFRRVVLRQGIREGNFDASKEIESILKSLSFKDLQKEDQRKIFKFIAAVSEKQEIKNLTLKGSHIGEKDLSRLNLPHLAEIDLQDCKSLGWGIVPLLVDKAPLLRKLNLSGTHFSCIIGAWNLLWFNPPARFSCLVELILKDCIALEYIRVASPCLKVLDVSGCKNLSELSISSFSLMTLSLSHTPKLPLENIKNTLREARALTSLNMSSLERTNALEVIDLSASLPATVEELNLQGNSLKNQILSRLQLPQNLKKLDLEDNVLTGAELQGLVLPPEVKQISLENNPLNFPNVIRFLLDHHLKVKVGLKVKGIPSKAEDISRLIHQDPTLTEIDLSYIGISLEDTHILSSYFRNSLEVLNLEGNRLHDEGIRILAPRLPSNLKLLNLARNSISDGGLRVLSSYLPRNLRELNLGKNFITDGDLRGLCSHLPKNLISLNLAGNKISDRGLEILAGHFPLQLGVLDLAGNSIFNTKAIIKFGETLNRIPISSNLEIEGLGNLGSNILRLTRKDPSLRELTLTRSGIGASELRLLAHYLSPSLRFLDLAENEIGEEGLKILSAYICQGLKHIILEKKGITPAGIINFGQTLHHRGIRSTLNISGLGSLGSNILKIMNEDRALTQLDLSYNSIGSQELNILIPKLKFLTSLNLANNRITDAGIHILLGNYPSPLRRLDLSRNQISTLGGLFLITHCPSSLVNLSLQDNPLPAKISSLASLAHSFSSLRELDLSKCQIGSEGAESLGSNLPPYLKRLNLRGNGLKDLGINYFTHSLSSIEFLDLGENWIKEKGVRSLVTYSLPSLIELDLGGNDIGSKGLQHIAEHLASHLPRLKILLIPHNSIADRGAEALALALPYSSLERIDLRNNSLKTPGIENLQSFQESRIRIQLEDNPGYNLLMERARKRERMLEAREQRLLEGPPYKRPRR